jgi:hypothetical protein
MVKPKNRHQQQPTQEIPVDANTEQQAEVKADEQAVAETTEQQAAPLDAAVEQPVEQSAEQPEVKEEAAEEVTEAPSEAPAEPVTEAPTEAPVVAAEPEAAVEQTEEQEQLGFLESVKATGTQLQKQILGAVERFAEALRPRKPTTPEAVVKAQNDFLDWMLMVLAADPAEFRKAWSVLLLYFTVYHGSNNSPTNYSALSEYRSNVFVDKWSDEERVVCYVNLLTLLRATRNIKTRQHDIKRIALDKISAELLDEKKLANLKLFYNV